MNIRKISTKNLVRILVVLIVLIGGIFAKKTLTSYALLENKLLVQVMLCLIE